MSDLVEVCKTARTGAIMSGSPVDMVLHPRAGTCDVGGGEGLAVGPIRPK